jgi:hypothetical protein
MTEASVDVEARTYWVGIKAALAQRGLLRQTQRTTGGDREPVVPQAFYLALEDRVAFILDMQRLAGVSREAWLDRRLWAQIRATLQGRPVFVADSAGLAVVVGRQPLERVAKRLPRVIPLTSDEIPHAPYTVTLGHDRRGPVVLDLAEKHRAILIGGATGGGKTNGMQAILAQLVKKHPPQELKLAIVDPKQIDFSGWAELPHLLEPIAHDMGDAQALIERVEAERIRRQAAMVRAGVSDWRALDDPPALLILCVDEAADFAGTPTMDTLAQVARKGRAFGVSVLLGTQYPTSDVIDKQTKANLTTAIAFRCRTGTESRVIIDRHGAEELDRSGLALCYVGGHWRRVQVLHAGDVGQFLGTSVRRRASASVLSSTEVELVRYAVTQLDGAFIIGRLYESLGDRISKHTLSKLGQTWEHRGWLTEPEHAAAPRHVTPELEALAFNPSPQHIEGVIRDRRDRA